MRDLKKSGVEPAWWRCGACWRISIVVLALSWIAIAAVMALWMRSYEAGLLSRQEAIARTAMIVGFSGMRDFTVETLRQAVGRVGGAVAGAAFYSPTGDFLADFGERPVSAPQRLRGKGLVPTSAATDVIYEVLWTEQDTGLPFLVVARLQADTADWPSSVFIWSVAVPAGVIALVISAITYFVAVLVIHRPLAGLSRTLRTATDLSPAGSENLAGTGIADRLADDFNGYLRRMGGAQQAAVLAAEQRFQDFATASSDWFWEMDEDLRFSYFSERFTEVTGVPQQALLGKTRQETGIPNVDPSAWETHLSDLAQRRPFRHFVHPRTLPDGTEVWLSINGKPIFDHNGTFKGYRGTGADITERKQAETAVRATERRYRSVIDTAAEGFWFSDVDGVTTEVNDALCQMMGYPAEEMIGRRPAEFVAEQSLPAFEQQFSRRTSRESRRYSATFRKKNGGLLHAQVAATSLHDESGEFIGSFALVTDISRLKEAEQEVLRNERLATLGQVTGSVSHELRNPLATIRTTLFTLREKVADQVPGVERALDRIDRNIGRCDDIIGELLEFARIQELSLQPIVLDTWVSEFLDEYTTPAGIHLAQDLHANATADIDSAKLHRALINVLDNACQALSDDAGTPREGAKISVGTSHAEGGVDIVIKDNGPGISDADMPKIIEPLYSSKSFGVGLGLPIVKQTIERHGGRLRIDSEEGVGTTVTLWLPSLQ